MTIVSQLELSSVLTINSRKYKIGEHPSFSGMPFGQEGRQGTVYQLINVADPSDKKALKVFNPYFRMPSIVYQAEGLGQYAAVQGLSVCSREVVIPQNNSPLLGVYPDLLYSVLMPWIEGPTWMDVLVKGRALSRNECHCLANSFAETLSVMEQRGLAHCDLSAQNILLPYFTSGASESPIQLVDVEQLYSPKLDKPEQLPHGSPGYAAHKSAQGGLWSKYADRFAGSVILAEILMWHDERIRENSWGESFFHPDETQLDCNRYQIMAAGLREQWGDSIAELFERSWHSEDLTQCPTFGEWYIAIYSATASPSAEEISKKRIENEERLKDQIRQAIHLKKTGNITSAIVIFKEVQQSLSSESNMYMEVEAALKELENDQRRWEKVIEATSEEKKSLKNVNVKFVLFGLPAVIILLLAIWLSYASFFQADKSDNEFNVSMEQNEDQKAEEPFPPLSDEDAVEAVVALTQAEDPDLASPANVVGTNGQPVISETTPEETAANASEQVLSPSENRGTSDSKKSNMAKVNSKGASSAEPPKTGGTKKPDTVVPAPSNSSKTTTDPIGSPMPAESTEPTAEKETIFVYLHDAVGKLSSSFSKSANYYEDKQGQLIGFNTRANRYSYYSVKFNEEFEQFRTIIELASPGEKDSAEIKVTLDGKLMSKFTLTFKNASKHLILPVGKYRSIEVNIVSNSDESANVVMKWPHIVRTKK